MRNTFILLTITALISITTGCYYDKEQDLYPNSFNANCDVSNVTFSNDVSKIISANCAISGCHVTPGQAPDLSTYTNIYSSKDRINVRACIDKTMPKGGALSSCDIQKLQTWITNGAANN